jgi:hypothetical protein
LTLDDDVAAKLRAEARKTDRSFRETVNDALRRGLTAPRASSARRRFSITPRDLGELRAGLSLDNIGDLLERVEGPLHR